MEKEIKIKNSRRKQIGKSNDFFCLMTKKTEIKKPKKKIRKNKIVRKNVINRIHKIRPLARISALLVQ